MKKIAVLGCGRVGKAIVYDLSSHFKVIAVDAHQESLAGVISHPHVEKRCIDISRKEEIKKLAAEVDLFVIAVPGFMGFTTLQNILECGKNVADISFFPENPFALQELAIKNKVTAIVDCGVAPGMSNLIAGYHSTHMNIQSFTCMVGGLPVERTFPFEYKAPFSPIDVIEEYTRPARMVENGHIITKAALSDPELINFPGIGTLEAFNTDGLRTLLHTLRIPNMKEKTLRYPGHIRLIEALKACGFLDTQKIKLSHTEIAPLELTTELLKKVWQLKENEEEFTVMKIIIEGTDRHTNQPQSYEYFLHDRYDPKTGFSSMARTTGFTCTAMVHLLAHQHYTAPGIHPPEIVGQNPQCFSFIMQYLKEKNIHYRVTP